MNFSLLKITPINQNLCRTFGALLVILLMPFFQSKAQVVCSTPITYNLSTEPVTTSTSNDGKLKITGDLIPTNRVLVSTSALAAASNAQYLAAPLYSTFIGGYWGGNITNVNQTLYVRIYSADGSCYTDQTKAFEKLNFITSVTPDVDVIIAHNGGAFVTKGNTITVTITARNQGTGNATGLEYTLGIPAGLTPVGVPTASSGTYNSSTFKWTLPSLVATTGTATLTMQFTVDTRGIKVLTANLTAETETDLDSSPTTTNAGEDDQGSVCISTPYDFCGIDIYTISLPNYTGVKWFKDGIEITAGNAAGLGVILTAGQPLQIVSLTAQADFSYTMTVAGSCPSGGCCPLRITPGLPPNISDPANQSICIGGTFSAVSVTNVAALQAGSTVVYEWYNNNGAANNNKNLISGQVTNTFTALPTTVGVYNYKVFAYDNQHPNCRDSAFVQLTVNALPTPTANGSSVCVGNTIGLTAGGGTTYAWSGPNSFTSTSQNPTRANATAAMAGVYTVTVTNGNGCTATTTANVTVNTLPSTPIVNSPIVCLNEVATLTATPAGGATLVWVTGGSTSTSVPVPNTSIAGMSIYSVYQYNNGTGCTSGSAVATVIVNPKPVAEIISINAMCLGSVARNNASLVLTKYHDSDQVAYGSPLSSTPTFTNVPTNGVLSNTLPNTTSVYTVRVINSFGCTKDIMAPITQVNCPCPSGYCEPATVTKTR